MFRTAHFRSLNFLVVVSANGQRGERLLIFCVVNASDSVSWGQVRDDEVHRTLLFFTSSLLTS